MYALADCNNFYVSCERVFDPSLIGKPVIVLSNNDGCAISRSEEAKCIGIKMGTAPHLIQELIREYDVKMFSSNYTLYGDMSDRVMKTLAQFVPTIELYSIDEAFLDLTGLPPANLPTLGTTIRETVYRNTGIPICIGIAPTRALAKMANRFAKKRKRGNGIHVAINQQLINEMLEATAVGDVWGIGGQYAQMLQQRNIKSAMEFVKTPEAFIRTSMSVVGVRLQQELKGISATAFEVTAAKKQQICCIRSFGSLITNLSDISEALSNFAATCALKLRQQNSLANELKIFINTNPHRLQDRQHYGSVVIKMDIATNNTTAIIRYAMKGLSIIFQEGHQYKKCGIEARDLIAEGEAQGNLFTDSTMVTHSKIMNTLDEVNRLMGKDLLRFGTQGFQKKYKTRAAMLSPKYTTRLNDIIKIKH